MKFSFISQQSFLNYIFLNYSSYLNAPPSSDKLTGHSQYFCQWKSRNKCFLWNVSPLASCQCLLGSFSGVTCISAINGFMNLPIFVFKTLAHFLVSMTSSRDDFKSPHTKSSVFLATLHTDESVCVTSSISSFSPFGSTRWLVYF